MSKNLNEQNLAEQPVIDWFKQLGYEYKFGPDISIGGVLLERNIEDDFKDVILENRLRSALRRLNPELSEKDIDEVVYKLKKTENPNLEIVNKEIWEMLVGGVRIDVENRNKELQGVFAKVIDFQNPLNNDFLVVNQFTIKGIEKIRRPDVVVFINGIPIAVFELKNPQIEEATIQTAYQQLQEYKKDISELFKYNQILAVSDLLEAKYGTISSSWEWFKTWKEVKESDEKLSGVSQLETLVKGIFQKARFLDIIENFIVFEADSEKDTSKFTKKICLYHQYFGVNKAVARTLQALKPNGDGKIGVLWHTQGSGKTLSMVFYVNKTKVLTELKGPTFVFLTDRNDLDNQFYKTFLRTGYDKLAKQAETIEDLRKKLENAGAELIFTTIQKFAEDFNTLSERKNIIVIVDEAHRTQYAELASRARKALPNASFMGITATPISLSNRNTRFVFGDYIDIYTMNQSVEDGATVPIYYESHLAPLHFTNYFIDEEFDDLTQEMDVQTKESFKRKFARLEGVVSAPERLQKIAEDIINHFNNRGVSGKAMVVTISRKTAVEMYKLISKIPNAPKIAVVISKPEEFKDEIQKETRPSEIERQFKKVDDPLQMVIVCDMWLTGFDVPPLQTMYFDKPLKNHSLIQAIARVNRIFKDKVGGLIVDYIGIADDLRKALSIFDPSVVKETMVSLEEIVNKMKEKYDIVQSMLSSVDYTKWKLLEGDELAKLFQQAINTIITDPKDGTLDEQKKERYLKESLSLIKLHAFVMPHEEAYEIKDEIEFFKAIRSALLKYTPARNTLEVDFEVQSTIKELISKSIAAEGIINILDFKNKEKINISILDETFLEEARKMKYSNLTIEMLQKLLSDEIKLRSKTNKIRYQPFSEMLEKTIEEYENRVISASKVIENLIGIAREIKKAEAEGKSTGLSDEELAFYDAISSKQKINGNEKMKDLVKELVKNIRRDISIDWTNNDILKARIRDDVRRLLLSRDFKPAEAEQIIEVVYQQALWLYKDYVPVLS
ncbi:MAG: type I restriction endonuclease subunit R [Candidatus Pacebacteria bacterium]|nr:type I restriction endonuclease subunit R [Candidatus Paceibacterota bacterium]